MVVVCVLGCGTLGSRVAGELAMCGHRVRVWDCDPRAMDRLPDQLKHERCEAEAGGLLVGGRVLGEVAVLGRLEEAVQGAAIVLEAVVEELEVKQEVMRRVGEVAGREVIIASSSLRLPLDQVFSSVTFPERTLGLRFLFPVYSISEVEVSPWDSTTTSTLALTSAWLERMGKTAFLRSGPEPLVLSEEEREDRWRQRAVFIKEHRGLGGRQFDHLPKLAHRGNFAPAQDDETKFSNRVSIEKECIICMDAERACLLAPCHHLATCQGCGLLLLNRADCCPVCRTTITAIVNFYRC